ncbi:hypothetical protein GCM10008090_10070 [Arenicella chitinivorans]|uniref:Uncharacterized protein n=1 Tax=Arenicella chitinivorans TaxID=1329800 RepID=A0A918VI24_9GAMM|nr:hypothetical protein GCM10008090_10070 [Arenicella chitinivorans]
MGVQQETPNKKLKVGVQQETTSNNKLHNKKLKVGVQQETNKKLVQARNRLVKVQLIYG